MSKNITLMGASYSAVPAVELPVTGGGTATFTDVTDTTAAASDVAQGKQFYTAAGVLTTGTASGGGGEVDPYPVRDDGKIHLWVLVDDMAYPDVTIRLRVSVNGGVSIAWGDGTTQTTSGTAAANYTHTYDSTGVYEVVLTYVGSSGYLNLNNAYTSSNGIMGSPSNANNANRLLAAELVPLYVTSNTYAKQDSGYLFRGCANLDKVTVLNGFTRFQGFRDGIGCRKFVNAARSLTSVGSYLAGLSRLERVVDSSGVYNMIASYGDCQRLYDISLAGSSYTSYATVVRNCTSLFSLVVPAGATNMIEAAKGCTSLRTVTIPDGVTTIQGAFAGCTSLRAVTIPQSVTTIGGAFSGCSSLQSITVPSGVTSLQSGSYYDTFKGCSSLKYIRFLSQTPPEAPAGTETLPAAYFDNLPTTCTIYVPAGTLAAYTSAANYPDSATYTYIEE